jgi:hypothetical protein
LIDKSGQAGTGGDAGLPAEREERQRRVAVGGVQDGLGKTHRSEPRARAIGQTSRMDGGRGRKRGENSTGIGSFTFLLQQFSRTAVRRRKMGEREGAARRRAGERSLDQWWREAVRRGTAHTCQSQGRAGATGEGQGD